MPNGGFTLFETAIGCCGLAWNGCGIAGVQLPEKDLAATRRRMQERFPEAEEAAPPTAIAETCDRIRALLEGDASDLSSVALDLRSVPPFHRRVYDAARKIRPGETITYGALAGRIGAEGAARAVGQALGRNPFPIVVPCHRVLAVNGKLGGFSAHGGIETKRRLLEIEGAGRGAPLRDQPLARPGRSPSAGRREVSGSRQVGRTAGASSSR